jgi:SAM-dependent methyltransferase
VTIADISGVGLSLARRRAEEAHVSIQTLELDLEVEPLPADTYDLIVSVCYLWRPLLASLPSRLAPGGVLAVVQPTKRNLERNDKPPAAYLLDEGELPRLIQGLEVLHGEEAWLADGRHDAVLVARRSGSAGRGTRS